MAHVDALNLAPVEAESSLDDGSLKRPLIFSVVSAYEQILTFQLEDEDIKNIIHQIENNINVNDHEFKKYVFENNVLYRVEKSRKLFVVPKFMRKPLCFKFHDMLGHFSVEKVIFHITRLYWFPCMRNYIKNHTNRCLECIIFKGESGKLCHQLNPIPPGNRPFEIINVDHLGPFVNSSKRRKYVFVVVCNLTKYVILYAVTDTTVKNVLNCMREFVNSFGVYGKLISDRGAVLHCIDLQGIAMKYPSLTY